MITKAWVFLRRLFGWPHAHDHSSGSVIKQHVHTEINCLLCKAQHDDRLSKHSPMMGNDRRMFCRKCGLPSRMWTGKCSGRRPPTAPKPQPLFMHIPID
jgi:hypothetical protein